MTDQSARAVLHTTITAPNPANAARWAESIRDLIHAEFGDTMRLHTVIELETPDRPLGAAPEPSCGEECAEGHVGVYGLLEHMGIDTSGGITIDGEPVPRPEQRRPDNPAPDDTDACRPVTVDGETIRVRGAGEFTEQEQQFVAEIVRAAKRKHAAEHPVPDDGLREQYTQALAAHDCAKIGVDVPGPDHDFWNIWRASADAVLAVRDHRMEQLAAGRATWKGKAEEIEADRDRLLEQRAQLQHQIEQQHAALTRVHDLLDRHDHRVAIDTALLRATLDQPEAAEHGPGWDPVTGHRTWEQVQADPPKFTGIRGLLEHVGIDTTGRTITVAGKTVDPAPGEPHTGLVVEPYRADNGQQRWVFRCWGTDTCDGWLSLDHHTQQSARRARDRHAAEHHAQEPSDV